MYFLYKNRHSGSSSDHIFVSFHINLHSSFPSDRTITLYRRSLHSGSSSDHIFVFFYINLPSSFSSDHTIMLYHTNFHSVSPQIVQKYPINSHSFPSDHTTVLYHTTSRWVSPQILDFSTPTCALVSPQITHLYFIL